jgi:hypothetical protein
MSYDITNYQLENVDTKDYPDFVDAFISYAEWTDTGRPLTEEELDILNSDHKDFIHQLVMDEVV